MPPRKASAATTQRQRYALYAGGAAVVLIAAFYIITRTGQPAPEQRPAEGKHAAASAWRRQQLEGLSVESPLELTRDPKASERLPAEVLSLIQGIEIETSGERGSGLQLSISVITYQPGVELTLEGAATSALAEAATRAFDPDPKFQVTPTSVKGFQAVRGSYRSKNWTPGVAMELLVIRNGQRLWQVQVLYTDPSYEPEMQRILASVDLAGSLPIAVAEKSASISGK